MPSKRSTGWNLRSSPSCGLNLFLSFKVALRKLETDIKEIICRQSLTLSFKTEKLLALPIQPEQTEDPARQFISSPWVNSPICTTFWTQVSLMHITGHADNTGPSWWPLRRQGSNYAWAKNSIKSVLKGYLMSLKGCWQPSKENIFNHLPVCLANGFKEL